MRPKQTEILSFPSINQNLGMDVYFASELMQVTHSFKYRAAWSVVNNTPARGFIAASSGNFGQALACACQVLGRKCIIVMPTTSAKIKIDAVRSYSAMVVLVDTKEKTRAEKVAEVALSFPDYHIASAYDCEHVIAGNASLGRELAELKNDFELIIAPVGGGGLSAGIIQGLKEAGDNTPVWGAEPALADDFYRSLKKGERIVQDLEPQTLADGARTLSVGVKNWAILSENIAGVLRVSEEAIQKAVGLFWRNGLRVEPTGALTLGALLEQKDWAGKKVMAVISGGNVDQNLFELLIQ